MPIHYLCRKCRITYSKEQFTQNKFCTSCGSFLLTTFYSEQTLGKLGNPHSSPEGSFDEKVALTRAAESLRQKIGASKEYEVVSESEVEQPKGPSFENWLWSFEYDEALKLEKKLLEQYSGKDLEGALSGKVVSNQQGECYEISGSCASVFKTVSFEESRRVIISDLKVIPGIGPVREQTLKQQGYKTVEDLTHHVLWNKQAREFIKMIDGKEINAAQNWLWRRMPKSHPLLHYLAGFCGDQDFAIVDIETLGLSERPIILLGIAKPCKTHICTSQFLLRDIQDEPSAIWALVSQLQPKLSLITYNGKGFDVPYIKQRLVYYGLDASLDNPHFDILHFTRRALKSKLKDCKLETVEKYLGIKRDVNIPGALVPRFYDTYLRTKNVGPLVAIVEHNKQDLLTLGSLFSRLYEEWNI